MRKVLAYLSVLAVAVAAGYWYAGLTGRGPEPGLARGASNDAELAPVVSTPADAVATDSQPARLDNDERNNIDIYRRFSPAVVNITTQAVQLDFFLRPVPSGGSGSGFLVDGRGNIVTNNHVVAGADSIQVTLADGTNFDASVVGTDPVTDLAVVRIDPGSRKLPSLVLGDSDSLLVGQKVLAIGNPFGLHGTLTSGIISALGRSIDTGQNTILDDAIQTDAAINPGNSGGPLLDSQGRVIGVNTLILDPTRAGASAGVGFAVPANTVKFVVGDLLEFGRVRRGGLGIRPWPLSLLPGLVDYYNLPVEEGVYLVEVLPGGGAAGAGLRGGDRRREARVGRWVVPLGGDVLVSVEGQPVKSSNDIYRVLYKRRPGETVAVTYYRGSEKQTARVTLGEVISDDPAGRRSRRF